MALHSHPYPEVFVLHAGRATFEVDQIEITAVPGDIVIAPAEAPHQFANTGGEELRLTAIHPASEMSTEWLTPLRSEGSHITPASVNDQPRRERGFK